MRIFRHGDLLIKQVKNLPNNTKKLSTNILAYGEHTGHSHRLIERDKAIADLLERSGVMYINVQKGSAELIHEEHETINIPKGVYIIIHEREHDYIADEIRLVRD